MDAPLLSGRRLSAFTPESFKEYVKSLYLKRIPKKSTAKKKKLKDYKVSMKVLKGGRLSVTTTRKPKYVTAEEYDKLALLYRENELFIALRHSGIHIYEDHAEAERIRADTAEIPF